MIFFLAQDNAIDYISSSCTAHCVLLDSNAVLAVGPRSVFRSCIFVREIDIDRLAQYLSGGGKFSTTPSRKETPPAAY
jgi:hypothetical protein